MAVKASVAAFLIAIRSSISTLRAQAIGVVVLNAAILRRHFRHHGLAPSQDLSAPTGARRITPLEYKSANCLTLRRMQADPRNVTRPAYLTRTAFLAFAVVLAGCTPDYQPKVEGEEPDRIVAMTPDETRAEPVGDPEAALAENGLSPALDEAAVDPVSEPASEEPQADRATNPAPSGPQVAIFAGGCFWCTEADFEKVPGVLSAVSGYTGGTLSNPTYEQISAGGTGHYEAVRITYDPSRVSYEQLTDYFFRTVDPTDPGGQFCDRGSSYRTAIFVTGPKQRRIAEAEKAEAAAALTDEVVTPILPTSRFWEAEGYHQDYYKENPIRYRFYRSRCGRDERLEELWGEA
jgi:peptide-methionine (S)-S-oxide reductase